MKRTEDALAICKDYSQIDCKPDSKDQNLPIFKDESNKGWIACPSYMPCSITYCQFLQKILFCWGQNSKYLSLVEPWVSPAQYQIT